MGGRVLELWRVGGEAVGIVAIVGILMILYFPFGVIFELTKKYK